MQGKETVIKYASNNTTLIMHAAVKAKEYQEIFTIQAVSDFIYMSQFLQDLYPVGFLPHSNLMIPLQR